MESVRILCPTPRDRLLDAHGRPYFLWDVDMTLEDFLGRLRDGPRAERAYWAGKLMRQAKPDDVLQWLTADEIDDLWPDLDRYLGRTREFWRWLLGMWGHHRVGT